MMFLIYFLIFISFWDLFVQLPITSTYAQSLGAATGFIGFIVGVYSFSNLFSNVFSGYFVDKAGPKKVLTAGFLINGLVFIAYAFVQSPVQMFIVRLINGFTSGILTPAAFTYATLYSKSKKSGKTMAFAAAAVGLAAITGPAIGGILSERFGHALVYQPIGTVMFLCGIVALLFLKPVEKVEKRAETQSGTVSEYVSLFKIPSIVFGYLGAFSLAFAQGILAYMLPLKVVELEAGDRTSGILISVYGIMAILFFLLPTNRIFDKFRNEFLLPIGMLVVSASLITLALGADLTVMFMAMSVYGIGFAILFPANASLVAKNSEASIRGKGFGLLYAFISLGSMAGSFVTGSFSMSTKEGFITSAIFLLIVSIVVYLLARKTISETANHHTNISG